VGLKRNRRSSVGLVIGAGSQKAEKRSTIPTLAVTCAWRSGKRKRY
jgi:hypothetical protein